MDCSEEAILRRENMVFEENRLKSFQIWPYTDKDACNIKTLAEAGFFWTGTKKDPDSAQCFVCNKSLDGWESTDDPWYEHKNHSPKCPFVEFGKKEEDLTLEQFYQIWKTMAKNIANTIMVDFEKKIIEERDLIRKEMRNFKVDRKIRK